MAFDGLKAWFRAPAVDTPAPQPEKKAPMSGDVAWSESIIYAGTDWPKYNPDELIRTRGARVYAQMMLDEQVKAVVRFKRDAITARRWYFDVKPKTKPGDDEETPGTTEEIVPDPEQPGSYRRRRVIKYRNGRVFAPVPPQLLPGDPDADPNDPDAKPKPEPKDPEQVELERRAYVFEAVLEEMDGSFLDALNGVMSAMQTGFSMTEKVLTNIEVDGKTWIGVQRLRLKPFSSFYPHVDEYGNLLRWEQQWAGKTQTIDPAKFIHHVQNPDVDAHYGQSELRECYRAWFSKDIAIRFWNIHLERHASGFFIIEPDKDAAVNIKVGTPEYNAIVAVLNNLSVKSGILLPNGVKGRLEKPNDTDAFEKAIASHDKAIAKALLVPNLLGITEQGNVGSYSQSQTQLEAFLWTLDAEASRLEETINEQLFRGLGDLNFGTGPYPRFCFEPISDALKLQIIKAWSELVSKGAVEASDTDEAHIRELLDFPEKGKPNKKPIAPNPFAPNPDDPNADTDAPPGAGQKPGADDRTIVGQGQMRSGRVSKQAMSRAIRRVDFAVIERRATSIEERSITRLDEVLRAGVAAIRTAVRTQDIKANPEAVADIALPASAKRKLNEYMRAGLTEAWQLGREQALREIRRAKGEEFAKRFDRGPLAETFEQFLESRAASFAADMTENTRKKIATILYNGIKGDWTVDEMVSRIDALIDSESIPQLASAVRTLTFEGINEARYDFFTQPVLDNYVQALEFSAIIDGKTTDVCRSMDGHIHAIDSGIWSTYTPPLHFNCRSLLIPVTQDDTWQESERPSIEPASGFG